MEYNELMKGLAEKLGIDDLEPDEDGRYSFCIDDAVVTFTELPQKGLLETVGEVCDLPDEGGDQLYRILLSAMAPEGAAEAFTFFIDSDKECICLRRTDMLSSLDVNSYHQVLENFANALEDWRESINDFCEVVPAINEALEQQAAEEREFATNAEGFLQV